MIYAGISVSFDCRLCETSFDGVGDFIEHKKTHHFQEFQRIKSIVFEERIFTNASQDYCGSVLPSLPLPAAPIIIKTETPANTNTDTNADYEYFYSEHELEPKLGNLIFEPKTEVTTFKNEIPKNPLVRLKRLSSNKIRLLTTSAGSRSRSYSNRITNPEICSQVDINFFHSHDDDNIVARTNEPFPTPVFENICKQENTTSSNCSEALTNKATPNNHMQYHQHDIIPQNYTAETVAAECNDDNEITHLITDEDIIPRPFKCPHPNCPKRFRYKESVNHHFASHTGLKPFKCPELNCEQKFTYKFALKMHSKSHIGKSMIRRRHRKQSRKEVHPEGSCGRVTSNRFKCPEPNCESSFSVKSYLTSHLHRHSDSKLFKCPVPDCGKTFNQRGSLYNHRAVHATVIIFTCPHPTCDKSYKFKYSRDRHMKLHKQLSVSALKNRNTNSRKSI